MNVAHAHLEATSAAPAAPTAPAATGAAAEGACAAGAAGACLSAVRPIIAGARAAAPVAADTFASASRALRSACSTQTAQMHSGTSPDFKSRASSSRRMKLSGTRALQAESARTHHGCGRLRGSGLETGVHERRASGDEAAGDADDDLLSPSRGLRSATLLQHGLHRLGRLLGGDARLLLRRLAGRAGGLGCGGGLALAGKEGVAAGDGHRGARAPCGEDGGDPDVTLSSRGLFNLLSL